MGYIGRLEGKDIGVSWRGDEMNDYFSETALITVSYMV